MKKEIKKDTKYCLKLILSPLLFLLVESQIVYAGPSEDFYNCLNSKKDNYFWTLSINQSTPQTINSKMTVEEILKQSGPESKVQAITRDAAQKSLLRFAQDVFWNSSKAEFNLLKDFTQTLRVFTRYLRMRLKKEIGTTLKSNIQFEIMLHPKPSGKLADKNTTGIVNPHSEYPLDRVLIAEPLIDGDFSSTFMDEQTRAAWNGMSALSREAVLCGNQAESFESYPLSFLIKFEVNRNIDESTITTQLVAGMPLNKKLPFNSENEKIKFSQISFPTLKPNVLLITEIPLVFINMKSSFNSNVTPINVNFGMLGSRGKEGWQRSSFDETSVSSLPKVTGQPKGVAGKILTLDFNLYNLVLQADYQDLQQQLQTTGTDFLISVGARSIPNYKVGKFNSPSVDNQFQTEINKIILAEIDKQENKMKDTFKSAKAAAVDRISKEAGMDETAIEIALKLLFSSKKK